MDGYWVVHLKSEGTVTENVLDFDKRVQELVHGTEEWTFKSCRSGVIAIIPRENILFAEYIREKSK